MLNKGEAAIVQDVASRLGEMIDAETAIVKKSSGGVSEAALLRRDKLQVMLTTLAPLRRADANETKRPVAPVMGDEQQYARDLL